MGDDVEAKWQVYPPPNPDELRVRIDVGADVEVSENLRTAVENLASAIAEQEDSEPASGASRGGLQVGRVDEQRLQGRPKFNPGDRMGDCVLNFCKKNSGFDMDPGALKSNPAMRETREPGA